MRTLPVLLIRAEGIDLTPFTSTCREFLGALQQELEEQGCQERLCQLLIEAEEVVSPSPFLSFRLVMTS